MRAATLAAMTGVFTATLTGAVSATATDTDTDTATLTPCASNVRVFGVTDPFVRLTPKRGDVIDVHTSALPRGRLEFTRTATTRGVATAEVEVTLVVRDCSGPARFESVWIMPSAVKVTASGTGHGVKLLGARKRSLRDWRWNASNKAELAMWREAERMAKRSLSADG